MDGDFQMQNISSTFKKRKQTNLETADAMFKDAFLVKKARFSHLHPELSEQELVRMTAVYFKKLNEDKSR